MSDIETWALRPGSVAGHAAERPTVMRQESNAVIALKEVLAPQQTVREIEPHLLSVLDPRDEGAPYDARAAIYDRAVSSRIYSRIAWGVAPGEHIAFIERALQSKPDGWVLDVAAGSCAASSVAYANCSRPIIVLDRSLGMLRRGVNRLLSIVGSIPSNVVFLQADATALPLRPSCMTTIVCHGAFHVFASPSGVCEEWARVVSHGGSLFVSSLVRGRWVGDRYLSLLHRAGEVTAPRSATEFTAAVSASFGGSFARETSGNFAYLSYATIESPAAFHEGGPVKPSSS